MTEHDNRQRFHDDLQSIRTNLPALRLVAARKASVMARSEGHGTRTVAPVPLNLGAFQLLGDVERLVRTLARACGLPNRRLPAEVLLKGVMLHETDLLEREDAARIMALARQAARRVWRMLNPPPETKMIGWCPSCGVELRCTELELAGGWCACRSCNAELRIRDVHRLSMLRLAVGGAQGTAASISRLLAPWGIGIKAKTISKWGERGIITPVAMDGTAPVFLVWDVWQAHTRGTGKARPE